MKVRAKVTASDVPQIHYGAIEVEEDYRDWAVLTSATQLPDQIWRLLKSKLYDI